MAMLYRNKITGKLYIIDRIEPNGIVHLLEDTDDYSSPALIVGPAKFKRQYEAK